LGIFQTSTRLTSSSVSRVSIRSKAAHVDAYGAAWRQTAAGSSAPSAAPSKFCRRLTPSCGYATSGLRLSSCWAGPSQVGRSRATCRGPVMVRRRSSRRLRAGVTGTSDLRTAVDVERAVRGFVHIHVRRERFPIGHAESRPLLLAGCSEPVSAAFRSPSERLGSAYCVSRPSGVGW